MASCTRVRFEALQKRSSTGRKNCVVGLYENARVITRGQSGAWTVAWPAWKDGARGQTHAWKRHLGLDERVEISEHASQS